MTRSVEIVEVGPRDGLQNEKTIVATSDKVELIRRAVKAGTRRIEIASFVNPRRVPQMADAEAVVEMLGAVPGVTRIGLTLNGRGAQRALDCGIDQLGAVCIASDTFGIRNQGQDSNTSVAVAGDIIDMARQSGRSAQATVAVAFGCPFEGEIAPSHVLDMVKRIAESQPVEIALADTIGVAVPAQVTEMVSAVLQLIAPIPVRVHFHNTRNTGIANVWAAVQAGASVVDASIGGLGGCPFAPGAAGNVATEDVAYMLSRSSVDTQLDMQALIQTSHWLETVLGKPMPSMLSKVSAFPGAASQSTG